MDVRIRVFMCSREGMQDQFLHNLFIHLFIYLLNLLKSLFKHLKEL